jgi:hypothetical protein
LLSPGTPLACFCRIDCVAYRLNRRCAKGHLVKPAGEATELRVGAVQHV